MMCGAAHLAGRNFPSAHRPIAENVADFWHVVFTPLHSFVVITFSVFSIKLEVIFHRVTRPFQYRVA